MNSDTIFKKIKKLFYDLILFQRKNTLDKKEHQRKEPKKLIIHAGPMKTGSTAIQAYLQYQKETLLEQGIEYFYLNAPESTNLLKKLDQLDGSRDVILSGEWLCLHEDKIKKLIADKNFETHVIMVHRPLTDLYVSLYLQYLKGAACRTSTFEEFVEEQIQLDKEPSHNKAKMTFNFSYLQESMTSIGGKVHWIKYSRHQLLEDFESILNSSFDKNLVLLDYVQQKPKGTSPLRSLNLMTADVARQVNMIVRKGELSNTNRLQILTELLSLSEKIKTPNKELIDDEVFKSIQVVDSEINSEFYNELNGNRG